MKTIKAKARTLDASKRSERRMTVKVVLLFVLFDLVLLYAVQAS